MGERLKESRVTGETMRETEKTVLNGKSFIRRGVPGESLLAVTVVYRHRISVRYCLL